MYKKIIAFILIGFILGCGSKKPQIQTSKAAVAKSQAARKKKQDAEASKKAAASGAKKSKEDKSALTLESTSKTMVYADQVKAYVQQYKGTAQANMKSHGVPASITLAQGILESGAGRGDLCLSANNHFGIKCHNDWTGDKVYHDDDSAQECFRKYRHAEESFNDHSVFLTTRGRYAKLFELEKDDYEGWARGLRAAGYATDPKYPEKLIGLIERFELAQYDREVLGTKPVKKPEIKKEEPVVVAAEKMPAMLNNRPSVVSTSPIIIEQDTPPETPVKAIEQAAKAAEAPVVAVANTYTVVKGDTLYSISKKNNITVDQLIQLNGLAGNAIAIGQVLKIK